MSQKRAIALYGSAVTAVAAFVGLAPDVPPGWAVAFVVLVLGAAGAGLMAITSRRPPHKPTNGMIRITNHQAQVTNLRQKLDNSVHHYQKLFDIVPCYITIHDRSYKIIESNRLFRQDFGEPGPDDRCFRTYKGRDRACPDCPVHKSFADGKVHCSEEKVITRDGHEAAMIVYSMPIHGRDGDITAVMEVGTNITQVKDLQRQLTMTGLAVTGMAHRIKNVLMGLEGGIFVVNTGFEDDDAETLRKGWEMVQRNVGRIGAMAHDLLFCSKEREPRLEENVEPAAVAREAVALFRAKAARESITLRLEAESNGRGVYDPEALNMLFNNLIANAIDACRFDPAADTKQHEIVVRCAEDSAGDAMVQVRDNGVGIAEEDSRKMFESFFSSKGTEGTGLGLFVVQKVVEQHDGTITFESHEGAGTAFTAVLRSQDERLAASEPDEPTDPQSPSPPPP